MVGVGTNMRYGLNAGLAFSHFNVFAVLVFYQPTKKVSVYFLTCNDCHRDFFMQPECESAYSKSNACVDW